MLCLRLQEPHRRCCSACRPRQPARPRSQPAHGSTPAHNRSSRGSWSLLQLFCRREARHWQELVPPQIRVTFLLLDQSHIQSIQLCAAGACLAVLTRLEAPFHWRAPPEGRRRRRETGSRKLLLPPVPPLPPPAPAPAVALGMVTLSGTPLDLRLTPQDASALTALYAKGSAPRCSDLLSSRKLGTCRLQLLAFWQQRPQTKTPADRRGCRK